MKSRVRKAVISKETRAVNPVGRRLLPLFVSTVLLTAVHSGCGSQPSSSPPTPARPGRSTGGPAISNLGDRIAALTADERRILTDVLADPFPDFPQPTTRDETDVPEHVAAISDALRQLTLQEADKLGSYLDTQHDGNGTEFAIFPVKRQQQALRKVQAIQKRITRPPAGVLQVDVSIHNPVTTTELEVPWLQQRLGREVQDIVGISFVREYYDLGPESTDVSSEEMRYVAALAGLRRLDLRLSQVGDAGLKMLQTLRHLELLDLRGTPITDSGLRYLANMDRLKELRLEDTDIAGTGLIHLKGLQRLRILNLNRVKVTSGGIAAVNELKSLHSLTLTSPKTDTVTLHDLPRLQTLHIAFGPANRRPKARVTHLPQLRSLVLSTPNGRSLHALDFDRVPRLRRIRLTSRALSEAIFKELGRIVGLRELILHSHQDRNYDREIYHLGQLRNLQNFWLSGRLSRRAMPVFEEFTALRRLHLAGDDLADESLQHLSKLPRLEEWEISGLQGTGAGMAVLQHMPHLKRLQINNSQLDELRLEKHPGLRDISGDQNHIPRLHLADFPQLRRLDFRRVELADVSLRKLPQLQWLSLSLMQADAIETITLHDLPRLETLQLVPITAKGSVEDVPEVANITDSVLKQVATLRNLRALSLNRAAITDAGLEHLHGHPQLDRVSVGGPSITPESRKKLKETLPKWKRLGQ